MLSMEYQLLLVHHLCYMTSTPKNMFGVHDRIYGLHFQLTLSKHCGILQKPFQALIRVEEFYGRGGKDFIFPIYHDKHHHNRYYVEAQLPQALSNTHQIVIVHIVDRYTTTLAHTFLTYHWLYKQRLNFSEKKSLDSIRCMVPNQKLKCHLSLLRLGCHVACTPSTSPFWPSQIKALESECSILTCWIQQNTRPNTHLPVTLVGSMPAPIFSFLVLDNSIDMDGFSKQGPISYTTHTCRGIDYDVRICGRIAQKMVGNTYVKLLSWIHMMGGGRYVKGKNTSGSQGFLFPTFNFVSCGESDIVGIHLCYLHLLYASQYMSGSSIYQILHDFLKTDVMGRDFLSVIQKTWPCIVVVRTSSQEYKLMYGLTKIKVLNKMIFYNESDLDEGDLTLMSTSDFEDDHFDICLISWRDYENHFLCTCLLQNKTDFDHTHYETIRGLGIRIRHNGNGVYTNSKCPLIFSSSHIRPLSTVCTSLEMAAQMNASKMMRPFLRCGDALEKIHERGISHIGGYQCGELSQKIPWHYGWVTNVRNQWEAKHVVSILDMYHCLCVSYLSDPIK